MNLLPIVERILLENDIQTDDLSKEVEISERGVAFLKDKIDKLNVKANRWGLPPMSLSVLHEREIPIKQRNMWGEEETVGIRKLFIVKIEGNPPRVEGYTFIGKVQHTTGGDNILNIAPGSPIKSLPEIYRTAKAECDVCKEKRERFNTFILQLDKEDHQRFSEKKVGDLVQVGSACLGRFLPGVSVDALMHYASIIEELRAYREGSGGDEWDDDMDYDPERGAPNPYRRHVPTETLLKYVALVYVTNGEYVSKSKGASSFGEKTPTSDEALNVMFDSKHQTHIHQEVIRTPSLKDKADVLAAQVGHWMKNMDFNELGKNTPEWQNYFGNLQIISRSSTMDIKNAGYLGGVFQTYLKIEREKEKEAKFLAYVPCSLTYLVYLN